MEGKCVMDVADPRARTLFENSKRVMDESYEPSSPQEPVLSVGHIDDEPGMLKQTVYDIVKYGADLYKILDRYEAMDTHVDLPHWIQSKIVLAREYISKATHYLEYESNTQDQISDKEFDIQDRVAEADLPTDNGVNTALVTTLVRNYLSLSKSYNNPNYKSTTHTLAAIKKIENKIRQMAKNEKYAEEFRKLMPDQFKEITKDL
jgi:hypothetical protein